MKYNSAHWEAYKLHSLRFNDVSSLNMLCSNLNQWISAMGKETWSFNKPEIAACDEDAEFWMKHWQKRLVNILGSTRLSLHQAVDEFIAFFCLDDAVPKHVKVAFGDRNYVSEAEHLGSDYALLVLRIAHFLDNVVEAYSDEWWRKSGNPGGERPYRFKFTDAATDRIHQSLKDNYYKHFVVDRIADDQPQVWLINIWPKSVRTSIGGYDKDQQRHSLILPYWGLPYAPLCYTAKSSGPTANKRKRKHAMMSTRPRGNVEVEEKEVTEPSEVQFMSYGEVREENKEELETTLDEKYSLTGFSKADCKILQFLIPPELKEIQKLSPHMHDFVQKKFARQLQWAADATKLLKDFFQNEYGRVHLLLSSWGREYDANRAQVRQYRLDDLVFVWDDESYSDNERSSALRQASYDLESREYTYEHDPDFVRKVRGCY